MAATKKKVIVFGASEGGRSFIKCQNEYDILALADNDVKKHGTIIDGYEVISPSSISKYNYDYIVIASMYIFQIQKQLTEELNITAEKIKFALKSQLKPSFHPFEDSNTIAFARRTLIHLIEKFNQYKIKYFVDYGTLLGIARADDLIPWDDDIDISIHPNDIDKTILCLKDNLSTIGKTEEEEVEWFGSISYQEKDKPISIDLDFKSNHLRQFTVNIGFIYFEKDLAVQIWNYAPRIYFENEYYIYFQGRKIRVPYKYEEYLSYTYGDWKKARKEITFADNALTFKEPKSLYKKIPL